MSWQERRRAPYSAIELEELRARRQALAERRRTLIERVCAQRVVWDALSAESAALQVGLERLTAESQVILDHVRQDAAARAR